MTVYIGKQNAKLTLMQTTLIHTTSHMVRECNTTMLSYCDYYSTWHKNQQKKEQINRDRT